MPEQNLKSLPNLLKSIIAPAFSNSSDIITNSDRMREKEWFNIISEKDLEYLERCVALAETALNEGDEPFGSILVSKEGAILFEDYNHVSGGDSTQHPEFAIARWAAENLSPEDRAQTTVYTSGEHCPMCSAAHAWVGLGRIVYASSSNQLQAWQKEFGVEPSPVKDLAIEDVILDANVDGPAQELAERVKQLHVKLHQKKTH